MVAGMEDGAVDIEAAVDATGSGWFGARALCAAGATYLACGVQWGLAAYILPAARCELGLTSAQMGAANALFMAGGMASAFVWGVLGDAWGRKPVIVSALLADAAATLCSALFARSYATLATFRFLNGFLIGAPSSLALLGLCESVPGRVRASFSLLLGGCWTASYLVLPALAWLVLPQPWRWPLLAGGGLTITSWRVLLTLLAAPALLAALLALRLPETPKYLVSRGRPEEALAVLRGMYAANTGRGAAEYPVRALAATLSLFRAPLLARTAVVCALLSLNEFGYYGLVLWLPELFNRFDTYYDLHPEAAGSVTVCELSRTWAATATGGAAATAEEEAGCAAGEAINEAVFVETLTVSGVCLAAYVLAAPVAGRVGRRALPFALHVASGVLAAGIYFVNSAASNLAVSSLFQALAATANTTVFAVMADTFPTRVSAVGCCCAIFSGRVSAAVSNLVMGALLDTSCEVPIFLFSATLIGGGLLCVLVPPPWTGAASPGKDTDTLQLELEEAPPTSPGHLQVA
ncbi:Synaptic vesicle glycoprotein 2B [Frankliniella fusca]|uniref:Synaptic vesicle glycoprotein 2B n=1 Tax=Frankliniella fusca TaxID=407009 RepID=A0AAE1LBX7_9NEOP|nr:Synaptic vesicle glycoprotein 2B [Frankliniella fusca]